MFCGRCPSRFFMYLPCGEGGVPRSSSSSSSSSSTLGGKVLGFGRSFMYGDCFIAGGRGGGGVSGGASGCPGG
jgi:hypothetical protein